jgi:hypothetical protein
MDHHEMRQIHGKWEQKWALDGFRFQVSSLIPPPFPMSQLCAKMSQYGIDVIPYSWKMGGVWIQLADNQTSRVKKLVVAWPSIQKSLSARVNNRRKI